MEPVTEAPTEQPTEPPVEPRNESIAPTRPARRLRRGASVAALTIALGLGWTTSAQAFRIVEPAAESPLASGQTVTARVDPGLSPGLVEVRYYWYYELEEVQKAEDSAMEAGQIGRPPTLVATADDEPSFGGPLRVPIKGIGIMRLLATGEITRGRLGSRSVFDEILVDVKPIANLVSIDFETEKPLRFGRAARGGANIDALGKTFELPVVGLYTDGIVRPISLASTGTTYESSDEAIVKVHPNGVLRLMGNGKATITVRNSGKEATLDVLIEVPDLGNEPPEADPGSDQTVRSGDRVILNGLNSLDPEGGRLLYHWEQIRGAKVPLLDLNMPKASFQAPEVTEPKLLRFSLRVTDEQEADSLPAYVDVLVKP